MADIPVNASDAIVTVDITDAGQVAFGYDFRADRVEDLRAVRTDQAGGRVAYLGGVDFTASGIGLANGGTVVFPIPVGVVGDKVTIYRNTVIDRLTDFQRDLYAATLNSEFDKVYMILQEIRRELSETFRVDPGETPPAISAVLLAAEQAVAANDAAQLAMIAAELAAATAQAISKRYGTVADAQAALGLLTPPAYVETIGYNAPADTGSPILWGNPSSQTSVVADQEAIRTGGTNIGTMTLSGGLAAAFNGVTNAAASACAAVVSADGWIGKTFDKPQRISQVVIFGSNSQGYITGGTAPVVTAQVYGKQGGVPETGNLGTLLASISFTDLLNESTGRPIVVNDPRAWDHVTVRLTNSENIANTRVAEMQIVPTAKKDVISVPVAATSFYYNQLHDAGEIRLDKHGMFLDGRNENVAFYDAFLVALDRGLKKIIMPGGKRLCLVDFSIPVASFDIDFGQGSRVLSDYTTYSQRVFDLTNGQNTADLTMRNLFIDGGWVSGNSDNEARMLDIAGWRNLKLLDTTIFRPSRGGGVGPGAIMDRKNTHTVVHNCEQVTIHGFLMDSVRNYEGLIVQSSDERTKYDIQRVFARNQFGNGSPLSVFYCGPGSIKFCDIDWNGSKVDGATDGFGSAVNVFSRHAEIAFNRIRGARSAAIDLHEGLFYAHSSDIHHNQIDYCRAAGILVGGNGVRITDNKISNCQYGIKFQVELNPDPQSFGPWFEPGEQDLHDAYIAGNRFLGTSITGITGNIYFRGNGSFKASGVIQLADGTFLTTNRPTYNVMLGTNGDVKIGGQSKQGTTAHIWTPNTFDNLVLEDLELNAQAGQSTDLVRQTAGISGRLTLNRVNARGTVSGKKLNVSGGTVAEVQINDSPTFANADITLPAGTRTLRDGKIYKAQTPFQITGNLAVGGRLSQTLAMPGVRSATDEVLVAVNVSNSAIDVSAYVSANDEVTVIFRNDSSGAVVDPSTNIRVVAGPRGYEL